MEMNWTKAMRLAYHVRSTHWHMVCQASQYVPVTWIRESHIVLRLAYHSVWHTSFLFYFERRRQRVHCLLSMPRQTHQCASDTCDWASHVMLRLVQLAREAHLHLFNKYPFISGIKGWFYLFIFSCTLTKPVNTSNTFMLLNIFWFWFQDFSCLRSLRS